MKTLYSLNSSVKKLSFVIALFVVAIHVKAQTNYYWVGGASNQWNTFNNWRVGSPTGSIPSSYPSSLTDHVFFGAYSNSVTPIVISQNISIGSFSASGCPVAPNISGGSYTMTIAGDIVLQSGMGLTLNTIILPSNSPQSITTSSVTINANVNITGNGDYSVMDLYKSTGSLNNTGNGNFACNGSFETVGFTKSGAGNVDFLNTTRFNGNVNLTGGGIYNFNGNVTGGAFNFTSGTLNTNNNDFNIGLFSDGGATTAHTLNAGITQFTLSSGGGGGGGCWIGTWNYTGSGGILNLAIPGSKISVTACGYLCSNNRFVGKLGDKYNDVWFANCGNQGINGNGMSFNSIVFAGAGVFQGNSNSINSLIFNGAGTLSGGNTFTTAVFNDDGSFAGNSSFISLTLNGYNYSFTSGSTQSITTAFTATVPSCTGLKEMNATAAAQANLNISISATTIVSNNSKFTGIRIIGNPISSIDSYDNGNNTNIVFPAPTPKTLYWVGGTGNWNDPNHWSLVNDGVYPPVSGCVPTLLDNVVFNNNSGAISTISLTGAPAYCHDMSWLGTSGTPTLAIPSTHNLFIYGSVILQNSLTIRTRNIFMMSSSTESITCNGARFGDASASINGTVTFSTTGTWQCQDDFYGQCVILNKGSLVSNNHYMNMFRMISTANTTLTVGTSIIDVTFSGAHNYPIWLCGGTINTNLGSLINIYGSYSIWPWFGFHTASNQTYYDVVFHNNTGGSYGVMKIGTNNLYHNVIFKKGGYVESNNTVFNRLDFGTIASGNNSNLVGSSKIDSLNCYGPYEFSFESSKTQTITASINFTNTPCGAKSNITSSSTTPALFNVSGASFLNINDACVSKITITGGTIITNNSIDMGNNTNINFGAISSKTLYWIGGSGYWNDKGHWTTDTILDRTYPSTTGCVPTRFDDVVFIGSLTGFTTTSSVTLGAGNNGECKNISWITTKGNPIFNLGPNPLSVYGSIIAQANMTWITTVQMITAPSQSVTITSNGVNITNGWNNSFILTGGGYVSLIDAFKYTDGSNQSFVVSNAVFNTNNQNFTVNNFNATASTSTVIIGSSSITVGPNGGWNTSGSSAPVIASAGSQITMTGGGDMITKSTDVYQNVTFNTALTLTGGGAKFNNVLFKTNGAVRAVSTGTTNLVNTINKLTFINNGSVSNNNYMDTLVLSAGRVYQLQSAGTQTVNSRLYASGNNCSKIVLNSTTAGTQAKLQVNAGAVNYAFGEVRDIDATPSYTPLVYSVASTDFGNNTNMNISNNVPTATNGIASNYSVAVTSMTLCNNQLPVTFNTRNYFPNPTTVFNWSDGSHADTLVANAAGMYSVAIVYAVSGVPCTLNAAINLAVNTTSVTVSSPTAVCLGNNSVLTASGADTYTWQPSTYLSNGSVSNPVSTPTANITYTLAGTNTLTGCYDTTLVSLVVNPTPSISSIVTNSVSCFGGSTGSATVNTTGGTPSYTYSYSPSVSSVINTATGLVAGNYTATVTDVNLCATTQTFTVAEPANAVSISSSNTSSVACFGASTGSLSLTATGGTPVYTYSWTGNASITSSATSLAAGNYTATVIDANLCTITQPFNVAQPSSAVSIASSNTSTVACFGASTGLLSLTPTGGTPAYTYSWTGSSSTTNSATSLAAGNYTATVTDANLCTITQTFNIAQPSSALSIVSSSSSSVACFGASTGSATINTTGGTPLYTYSWIGSSSTSNFATSLSAGNYTATVTDANLCITTQTFNIAEPTQLTVALTSTTQAGCTLSNGSATITATGGSPAYTYSWTPPSPSPSFTTTAAETNTLAAGITQVLTTDANGCTTPLFITISNPNAPVITPTQTNVLCYGDATGVAEASITNGTAPYTYSWSPSVGSSTNTASSLTSGNYILSVVDVANCTAGYVFNITQPAAPLTVAAITTNSILCFGDATGSATINPTGGTPSYTVTWENNTSSSNTATSYAAGNYTYQVADANGCVTTNSFVISEPSSVLSITSFTQSNVTCFGSSTGSVEITVMGGIPNYNYSWTNSSSASNSATGLSANDYTVTVKDENGCTITQTIAITEPPALAASITNTTQAGCGLANGGATVTATGGTPVYTYSWTNASNTTYTTSSNTTTSLSAGSNNVILTDANGCTDTLTTNITNPNAPIVTTSVTNVLCYGRTTGSINTTVSNGTPVYSYTWSTGATTQNLNSVSAGNYSLVVVDASNCMATYSTTINQPSNPLYLIVDNIVNANCYGETTGSANVFANGGTPSYSYNWLPGNTSTLTNAVAGNYTITATDNNGCATQSVVTISGPSEPLVLSVVNSENSICDQSNGTINATVNGGTPNYTYNWSNGTQSQALVNVPSGTYTLTVVDANNCKDTLVHTITCRFDLYVPQIFSPNGDGKNDKFEIRAITDYPNNSVQIFNRWGSLIYAKNSYKNEWDGKSNVGDASGKDVLPAGTYFVVIDFGDNKTESYKGYVMLEY